MMLHHQHIDIEGTQIMSLAQYKCMISLVNAWCHDATDAQNDWKISI